MRFKIKTVFMLLVITLFCFSVATGLQAQENKYKPLLGTWDVEADMGMAFVFEFTMEEEEISGKMSFDMGDAEVSDIAIEENTVTFTVTIDANGQIMEIGGEIEIDGDSFSGFLSSDMGETTITGTKRKDG